MSQPSQHDTESRKAGVEPDLLPIGQLVVWIGALTALVFAIIAVLWQYFQTTTVRDLAERDLQQPAPMLAEVRARDKHALSHYDAIDPQRGIYRIPVARAIDLLVANPELINPVTEPKAAPAPPKTE